MKPPFTISAASLPALLAFARVAEHASFTRAADELAVSPSALSQTIRALEDKLGVRLLNRTTRKVGLSEAGAVLLARLDPALADIDAAFVDVAQQRAQPAGVLRITVPQGIVRSLLDPHLAAFMAKYPAICLDVLVDSSLNDLISMGLDAGIRLGEKMQLDMVARPLGGKQRSVVVGSPDYFSRHSKPAHPRELAQHDCVRARFAPQRPPYRWEFAERGRWYEAQVDGNLITNDGELALRAAIDGAALVYTMLPNAQAALDRGLLLSVLDAFLPPYDGFYLYYPNRAHLAPKLRAFADFMAARMRAGGIVKTPHASA